MKTEILRLCDWLYSPQMNVCCMLWHKCEKSSKIRDSQIGRMLHNSPKVKFNYNSIGQKLIDGKISLYLIIGVDFSVERGDD